MNSPFEQTLSASIRALSGYKDAQFDPTTSPITETKPSFAQLQVMRGTADSSALMLRYHNPSIHRHYLPDSPAAQDIFNKAEQTRVESLGSLDMKGVADNITAALQHYALLSGYNQITGHEKVPLADIIGFLLREAVTGIAAPDTAIPLMKIYGEKIKVKIFKELVDIAASVDNQEQYAQGVNRLIHTLQTEESTNQQGEQNSEDITAHSSSGEKEQETAYDSTLAAASAESEATVVEKAEDGTLTEGNPAEGEHNNASDNEADILEVLQQKDKIYHPYTQEFDETIAAEALCSAEELARLREQLDSKLQELQTITARLAHRLQRKLIARQRSTWELNQEEGIIDSSRLGQLIASPTYPLLYKWEKKQEQIHTVVTLLLDNSGSMRGRPITIAAMSANILAQTLERCGIKVEILGFTTCDWKGGKSRKLWVENGSPPSPGRLNDIRHIIYKSADTPWRRAKKNLGLMLKEGILKENIDGEAILWAHSRLLRRPEKRRILMVISDGAPVDDSTSSANDSNYLEQHLKNVIHTIEQHSAVELLAIGIGHDVGRYYRHAVAIRDAEQLGDTMFGELSTLL